MKEQCIANNGVQYVYLDFDGELTTYRNEDLNITVDVEVKNSGMSEEQKRYILAELSEKYANKNIVFTVEKPEEVREYSTIFIGQTDDFDEYGSFAGLAETIDEGNQIKDDNAFVLADYTNDTDLVISIIDHEIGHIFEGMEHEYVSGDINDFAGNYHLYGPSLSLGTISCPATVTGCVSGSTFDTYHYTSYFSFNVTQSGYYTVLLKAQHASGGTTTVSGRVSGPPDIWDNIYLGSSASFYFTAGETYSIQVSIPMFAATNSSSVYNYTCTITSGGGGGSKYDLRTYTPSGWSAPIVVSNRENTNTSSSSFTTNDNIYLDAAVLNDGGSTISKSFTTAIYIDNVLWDSWTESNLQSGYYTYIEDLDLGKFSAGTHTIKLVADSTGAVTETNENNNTYTTTFTVTGVQQKFDLQAYTPSGWSAPIVVSNIENTNTSSSSFTTNDNIYLDAAVLNDGDSTISKSFTTAIYIDNVLWDSWTESNLQSGYYTYIEDLDLGKFSAGTHTIKLVADSTGAVTETNENNNTYTKTFTVVSAGYSDLAFYTPSGWSDKLVISTQTGTSTNSATFTNDDTIYLDFAVKNQGTVYTDSSVYVDIYVDGVKVDYWLCSTGLNANATYSWTDKSIGKLSAGTHTIKLQIRQDGAETTTSNNTYSKTITVEAKDTISPTVPQNIIFSEANGYVFCDWDDSTDNVGVVRYEFQYIKRNGSAKPDFTSATVKTTSLSSITLNGLTEGDYYYKLFAVDAAGNYSSWSSSTSSFTVTGSTPGIPGISGDVSFSVKNEKLIIDWNDATYSGCAGYQIRLSDPSKVGSTPTVYTVYDSSYSLAVSSSRDKTWNFEIRTFNSSGLYSDWSDDYEITILSSDDPVYEITLSYLYPEKTTLTLSTDDFGHGLILKPSNGNLDLYSLPGGVCKISGYYDDFPEDIMDWNVAVDVKTEAGRELISNNDSDDDLFFGNAKNTWTAHYSAQHTGTLNGWSGTGEVVALNGKNKIIDLFMGSSDANVLVLTDDTNGDALFVDDIYSALGTQARLSQIDEIRAGVGNDIIDLTSNKYAFAGDGVTIYGGAGADTIWANSGSNTLFGDAGNDRIVGGSGNDFIIGGPGHDSLHGGGGNDTFCFAGNWGSDTITQLAGGKVTLHFASGSMNNWNAATRIYSDGANSVKVIGTSDITLKFGSDAALPAGALLDVASEKIFEDKDKGMLA